MSKYDYFFESQEANITPLGKKIVDYQNNLFIDLIESYSKEHLDNVSLLEIGPGKGDFAKLCIRKKIQYTSIEENQAGVLYLKEQNIPVVQSSVPPLPGEKKYNVILMNQVLEHMHNLKQVTSLMEELSDRLTPGGLLMVSCPDILTHGGHFYNDYTHSYPTTIIRLRRIFQDFGLEPIYDRYYTLFVQGFIATRIVTTLSLFSKNIGILDLFFKEKSDKILSSLLPSFVIVGKKSLSKSHEK